MNFKKSCPTRFQRALAMALSAGFLSFLPGCTLRESVDPTITQPVRTESALSAEQIVAQFSTENPTLPALSADKPQISIEKPDLSEVFALPERIIHSDAAEWIGLSGEKSGEILLTEAEIAGYNRRIIDNCPTVVDIADPPETMSGQTVRDMISRYSMPAGDHFTRSGDYIDSGKRQKIEARRAADQVPETVTVRRALITNRCDLKSLPTSVGFHNYGDRHYSGIQETELITGFPVWILHESPDGAFYFVQSYYYAGWIPSDCAALCSDTDFERYAKLTESGNLYVTVTAPRLDVNGTRLDMGAVFPYLSEDESSFTAEIPGRDETGNLFFRRETIAKSDAVLGSLPYTMENYYNQAFAFLGTPYGWGGADGNVDCSGFVCAVFRCFGMYLPRNTGEQSRYNGEIINLAGIGADQKYRAFADLDSPASVHWSGHVMLYLGEKNGSHYVIHAPQGGETVTVMPLNMNSTYICAIRIR
ncbi:MAG: SH3 domain-containing protein [Clostridia bacterium]|nr:SH3 domain-containing protein [Clostridia bacterium]